jgi:hypothetical protein
MPLAYPRLRGLPSANFAGNIQCPESTPLFEFSLRLEPPATSPSHPSRSKGNSSRGLCFPTAHEGSEVHLTRVLPARYVPPSGFDYPLDGFLPPDPRRPFFMPTALLGFRPPEHLLPERHPRRYRLRLTRLPFLPPAVPSDESSGRTGNPRLPGFDPSGNPAPTRRG